MPKFITSKFVIKIIYQNTNKISSLRQGEIEGNDRAVTQKLTV